MCSCGELLVMTSGLGARMKIMRGIGTVLIIWGCIIMRQLDRQMDIGVSSGYLPTLRGGLLFLLGQVLR